MERAKAILISFWNVLKVLVIMVFAFPINFLGIILFAIYFLLKFIWKTFSWIFARFASTMVAIFLIVASYFIVRVGFRFLYVDDAVAVAKLSSLLGWETQLVEVLINDFYANVGTEIFSIAITVLFIDNLNSWRATQSLKAQIKFNLGSSENVTARAAARMLKYRGWFTKNILRGTDLSYANLKNADLTGADLSETDLFNAKLQDAYLDYGKLNKANLERARLENAHLEFTELNDASLKRANLQGANLRNASLVRANLDRANLRSVSFFFARLDNAYLASANLTEADLRYSSLEDANLFYANLTGANLQGARLNNINLEGAILPDGTKWNDAMDKEYLYRFTDDKNKHFKQIKNETDFIIYPGLGEE